MERASCPTRNKRSPILGKKQSSKPEWRIYHKLIDKVDLDDSKKDLKTRENKTKCKLTLVGIDITSYISVEEDKNSWKASAVDVGWG